MSTPILNMPQSGILGMHKIQQRPMVMPDGSIQARPMMYLALTYDHRIVDGKEAVTFLVAHRQSPEREPEIWLNSSTSSWWARDREATSAPSVPPSSV